MKAENSQFPGDENLYGGGHWEDYSGWTPETMDEMSRVHDEEIKAAKQKEHDAKMEGAEKPKTVEGFIPKPRPWPGVSQERPF